MIDRLIDLASAVEQRWQELRCARRGYHRCHEMSTTCRDCGRRVPLFAEDV